MTDRAASGTTLGPPRGAPPRVLIVDDNPANIGVLVEALSGAGYRVLVARDGQTAIEQAAYALPRVILLDVMMPGLDGFETCRRLQAVDTTCEIPVIFMTALTDVGDKVRAFEAGAVDYVTKPLQHAEVLARVATHTHLSELRQSLREANEHLEERVRARTAELEAESQARAAAEAAKREMLQQLAHVSRLSELGEMSSVLAHELNQPLTAILSFAQAGQRVAATQASATAAPADTTAASELATALERIAANAERAGKIIRRIRAFVRKGEPVRELAPIAPLIDEVHGLVEPELQRSGARLEVAIAADLPPVLIDRIQIQQVLLNLVRNAIEAQRGQDRAWVSISGTRDATQTRLLIRVADGGPGVAAEVACQLFEPFVTSKGDGLGLGLAICRSIIEAHSGTLSLVASAEPGAVFEIALPVVSAR